MIALGGKDAETYGYSKAFVTPSAASRFAKESKCDLKSTTEERIDWRTHVVEGCGHRVTYVNSCGPSGCSWIANVEATTR